jgi:hypothetical protein
VRGSTPQISPGRKSFNSVVNQSVLGLGVRSVKQLSVKTRPGRLFINIVRKPCVKVSIRATARKQSAKHLGRIPQNIGRQSLHWAHATNAPVSIGHWSLLRLSARTEALRPSLKKGPRSAIFIQWECSSQTRLHSLPSSVRVHSSFDRSFQPQSSICDAEIGIKELGFLGRSLNRRKCNSITGQPQQRYKWECYGINRVVSL